MPPKKSVYNVLRSATTALVLTIGCCTTVIATPADDACTQGKELLHKKDYMGAIKQLDKAIKLNPKLGDAYVNRARAFSRVNQDTNAIEDLNRVFSLI